jgi:hypothetical protein
VKGDEDKEIAQAEKERLPGTLSTHVYHEFRAGGRAVWLVMWGGTGDICRTQINGAAAEFVNVARTAFF